MPGFRQLGYSKDGPDGRNTTERVDIITLNVSTLEFPLSYKFVACNADSKQVEEWENHDNRMLNNPELKKGEIYLTPETEVHFTSSARKVAGTAIPVFSLRSEKSFGVGDFGDLKKLIDWAAKTHQQAVQILPINDTTITHTWMDSYPYNSISIYAFHPMYIDLNQLGKMKDKEALAVFEARRQELNALPQIDYEEGEQCQTCLFESDVPTNRKESAGFGRIQKIL